MRRNAQHSNVLSCGRQMTTRVVDGRIILFIYKNIFITSSRVKNTLEEGDVLFPKSTINREKREKFGEENRKANDLRHTTISYKHVG